MIGKEHAGALDDASTATCRPRSKRRRGIEIKRFVVTQCLRRCSELRCGRRADENFGFFNIRQASAIKDVRYGQPAAAGNPRVNGQCSFIKTPVAIHGPLARPFIGNEHERLASTADGRRPIKTSIDVTDCRDDQFVRNHLDVVVHCWFRPVVIFNAERRSAVAARFQGVCANYIAVRVGDGQIRTAPSVIRGIEHFQGVAAVGEAHVIGVRSSAFQ